jgi:hypothetical protein
MQLDAWLLFKMAAATVKGIIEVLHDHVTAAMLDGRTIESISPKELN